MQRQRLITNTTKKNNVRFFAHHHLIPYLCPEKIKQSKMKPSLKNKVKNIKLKLIYF